MKIHIFNPEHDIALSIGSDRFTPPHAACRLRADLGFLPALWAEDGDYVLVDDAETAETSSRRMGNLMHRVHFITPNRLATLSVDDRIRQYYRGDGMWLCAADLRLIIPIWLVLCPMKLYFLVSEC